MRVDADAQRAAGVHGAAQPRAEGLRVACGHAACDLPGVGADRVGEGGVRARRPAGRRGPGGCARRPERARVDEGAVALDERGAGQDPLPGVLGVLDAADADQGDPVADPGVQAAQHLQGALLAAARRTGRRSPPSAPGRSVRPRPSRAMVVLVAMMPSRPSSTARSATASTSSSARSGAILTSSGTRRPVTVRSAASRTAVSSGRSAVGGLEVAQAGGVRRGDVDDEVVGVRGEPLGGGHVVGDGLRLRDDLGLADVDADRRSGRPAAAGRQAGGDGRASPRC